MSDYSIAKRSKCIYVLPNLFTLAGLFSGFLTIVLAFNHDFILATLMDTLDGRVLD